MNAIAKKLAILLGVLAFASSCTAIPNSSTETQRSPKVRDFQEINYPILWGGHLARL
ncbi:MAG: hypothetical protein V7K43_30580 [Nostoc sp.]